MKKYIYFIIILLSSKGVICGQVLTLPDLQSFTPGMWLCYRTQIDLNQKPENIELRIAADSKYWMWVNGNLYVREGGLKRGPNPQDTYCDVLNDTQYWDKGNNVVAILVWYWGKEGFSHRTSPVAGITFDLTIDGKKIDTDSGWRVKKHPAFYVPQDEQPNFRLPESNIGFDANKDIPFYAPSYKDHSWSKAHNISLQDAGWNKLIDRPIPMWKDYGMKSYVHIEQSGNQIVAYLPYNAQITPYIKLQSRAGEKIDIRTDNYNGGSEKNVYAEYITCEGLQEYECMGWMNGHYVIYTVPEGCDVKEVKYRETGYDCDFDGYFWCDNPLLTQLWHKAQRTLYVTMRDTYMDCPDRERAQWWGDVVNELGEAFYALDEKAHLLTRKAIMELMDWQRADSTIFSPIPSGNWENELPMQMLASVGYYGFWTYYMGSGDKATIEYVYPKVKKYIHVWHTDEDGLVIPRKGGWTWGDWGDNKDMYLLFNQWYAIALEGYGCMAQLVGDNDEMQWAMSVAERLKKTFHQKFWNGSYYISPDYKGLPDDRVQSLAIISNTLPENLYSTIRPFFKEQYHASPYMEKYVLQALCHMGYHQDALDRMSLRYASMVKSPLSTLWEGWGIGNEGYGGGSYNHAWSGGPLTILSAYIAGIQTVEPAFATFSVSPHPGNLSHIKATIPLSDNRYIKAIIKKRADKCYVELEVPAMTTAVIMLPNDYTAVSINGKRAMPNTKLAAGKWEIVYSQD